MKVAEIIATKFQAQEHKHVTVHTSEVTEINICDLHNPCL
jgi:hypothetical protein